MMATIPIASSSRAPISYIHYFFYFFLSMNKSIHSVRKYSNILYII
jgi:hypothetical protein